MASELTPMMKQYHAMRQTLPADVILLFRLGDFYEMFFEDAKVASEILKLTLTKRNGIPMAGVPFHAGQGYIRRLVKANKRVAIAEQVGDPVPGKLTAREISQVITAGTVNDASLIDSDRPLYLAAVYADGKKIGIACVDHTTGVFRLAEVESEAALQDELARLGPSETLYSTEQIERFSSAPGAQVYDGYAFLYDQAFFILKEHFKVQSLDGFGCAGMRAAVGAAGAILHYLRHQLQRNVDHLRRLQPYTSSHYVIIDTAAQQHLDLVQSRGGKEGSLLHALDRTSTPMGARTLRDWILRPLRDLPALLQRQDTIAAFIERPSVLGPLRDQLRVVRDIERLSGRLSQGSGNARDLQALAASVKVLPDLRLTLSPLHDVPLAASLAGQLSDFTPFVTEVEAALVDEPPATIKEGGLFREGYSPALDELRAAAARGKDWIAELQAAEIERTGIKSLKIRYNGVIGYFIEITKANLKSVPADYIRKGSMVNAERYITPGLKEVEDKVLGAEERAKKLEQEEFLRLRDLVTAQVDALQTSAQAIASLDVLASLAEGARLFNWTRPLLNESRNLYIKNGRHPVLDQVVSGEKFVPNDTTIEPEQARLIVITGPNMAGKSTYIRQVALLTLLAQTGSFIPASSAEIGLVDRIFTRVGASDDLSRGQSTFMVEMNETALIIINATDRSLVILDEIGRGTSTFDGLSLAWSIAEHLHDKIQARSLFATHYHELTALSRSRPGVQNWNVAVREWNDQVIFLRKIVPGSADKSYGLHVARLAGLPDEIISRAKVILAHLETSSQNPGDPAPSVSEAVTPETSAAKSPTPRRKKAPAPPSTDVLPEPRIAQMTLF